MIKSFKHKGLELFYETGNAKGLQVSHKKRLRFQLTALDSALDIEDVRIPGYGLHQLKDSRKDIWSIAVNGNWRLTFEFREGNAYILNYEDYH